LYNYLHVTLILLLNHGFKVFFVSKEANLDRDLLLKERLKKPSLSRETTPTVHLIKIQLKLSIL